MASIARPLSQDRQDKINDLQEDVSVQFDLGKTQTKHESAIFPRGLCSDSTRDLGCVELAHGLTIRPAGTQKHPRREARRRQQSIVPGAGSLEVWIRMCRIVAEQRHSDLVPYEYMGSENVTRSSWMAATYVPIVQVSHSA